MALEWVGRGGFTHVSTASGGRAGRVRLRTGTYAESLPRTCSREIRRCVNYSVVTGRSCPGRTPVRSGRARRVRPGGRTKPAAPSQVPDTRSAAPHGSLPCDTKVHKAAYGQEIGQTRR
ncbi:hypothetical protein GCM10010498_37670 [Streptomyces cavourensis]|nr:hypothetical protein GCM10010498_37670 [Streptomyces cavourensis]